MPEKWIESAGPSDSELSKKAFEEWWGSLWFHKLELPTPVVTKKIAFAAWEHQRQQCSALITQILSIVKEI